jgi:myo-inositol-1(or 4)-monophosphatase
VIAPTLEGAARRRFDTLRVLTRRAGVLVLEGFGKAAVGFKADDSMVTDVDGAVQAWLEREIVRVFPEDVVVGEEGFDAAGTVPAARHVWVVDPIDGTNNYGRGMPGFSISIGIVRDGVAVGGAVYDPLAGQLFAGWTGQGAWLNERRLRLAPAALDRRSLFAIRTPYAESVPPAVMRWLTRYRLRRAGSTALQLCYVALGAIAFVYDHRTSLWDIAGAAPVVLEAGACLTSPDGRSLFPIDAPTWTGTPLPVLAGAPRAHEAALADLTGTTLGATVRR